MKKHSIDLDFNHLLEKDSLERLNERVTVPVSADMYTRLERLGKRKNDFIRALIEKALPAIENALASR